MRAAPFPKLAAGIACRHEQHREHDGEHVLLLVDHFEHDHHHRQNHREGDSSPHAERLAVELEHLRPWAHDLSRRDRLTTMRDQFALAAAITNTTSASTSRKRRRTGTGPSDRTPNPEPTQHGSQTGASPASVTWDAPGGAGPRTAGLDEKRLRVHPRSQRQHGRQETPNRPEANRGSCRAPPLARRDHRDEIQRHETATAVLERDLCEPSERRPVVRGQQERIVLVR